MKTLYPTLCTAALLMLAACTQDPVEDLVSSGNTQSGDLPEGTFIVDYLPSADLPATRGLGEGEAILSLDYLLYERTDDNTYTLKKRTPISDISADTHWPLTRENMTWQQRQELKDTLNTGSTYKAVFVANANQKVWTDFQPMTGIDANDNFDDARLLLPPNGDFQQTDGTYTFYYMWTGEIDPNTNGYDKNTPAQMNVVLQRMVNKVEIRLDTESIPIDKGRLNDSIKNVVDEYYKALISNSPEGKLHQYISNNLEKLSTGFKVGSRPLYEDAKNKIADFVNNESFITSLLNNELKEKIGSFITELETNYNTLSYWGAASYVKINYAKEGFAEAINFKKESITGSNTAYSLEVPLINNSFIYYAFGNNVIGKENKLNAISTYEFLDANKETILFSISGNELPINDHKGGNLHLQFKCNPIAIRNDDSAEDYNVPQFSIINKMGENWNKTYLSLGSYQSIDNLINYMNNNSDYKDTDNEYIYAKSQLNGIHLKIKWPKVSITPQWYTIDE